MLCYNCKINNKIYINVRLIKDKRIVFAKTRTTAKDTRYKFVWISNADILLSKMKIQKSLELNQSMIL